VLSTSRKPVGVDGRRVDMLPETIMSVCPHIAMDAVVRRDYTSWMVIFNLVYMSAHRWRNVVVQHEFVSLSFSG
jgi:hypothetical protein